MKERLTTRLDGYAYGKCGVEEKTALKSERWHRGRFECTALIEKLAEYEDAEEQGLIVRLPSKIDTFVYAINKFTERIIYGQLTNIEIGHFGITYTILDIEYYQYYHCKEIFLISEKAEKKLKELKGDE